MREVNPWLCRRLILKLRGKRTFDDGIVLETLLTEEGLLREERLTWAGLLLLGQKPQKFLPASYIEFRAYNWHTAAESALLTRKRIDGPLSEIFETTQRLLLGHLRTKQVEESFNSLGVPEIPLEALQGALANALVHRDLLVEAPIQVAVFRDHVEIRNPRCLPNQLTLEQMITGGSYTRNPVLRTM